MFLYLRVNLESIKLHVDERTLDMEVIVNPKSLEGAHQGVNVIQLETAVGAAMKVIVTERSPEEFSKWNVQQILCNNYNIITMMITLFEMFI